MKIKNNVCLFLNIDVESNFKSLNVVHNSSKERKKIILLFWTLIKTNPLFNKILNNISEKQKNKIRDRFGKKINPNITLSERHKQIIIKELEQDLLIFKNKYQVNIDQWKISKYLGSSLV